MSLLGGTFIPPPRLRRTRRTRARRHGASTPPHAARASAIIAAPRRLSRSLRDFAGRGAALKRRARARRRGANASRGPACAPAIMARARRLPRAFRDLAGARAPEAGGEVAPCRGLTPPYPRLRPAGARARGLPPPAHRPRARAPGSAVTRGAREPRAPKETLATLGRGAPTPPAPLFFSHGVPQPRHSLAGPALGSPLAPRALTRAGDGARARRRLERRTMTTLTLTRPGATAARRARAPRRDLSVQARALTHHSRHHAVTGAQSAPAPP